MAKLAPLHPGEVLREEFMVPMGLTAYALADRCHIPRTRIERIANEQTSISADTALRLAKALGTTPEFWLNLQARYAMEITRPKIINDLETIEMANGSGHHPGHEKHRYSHSKIVRRATPV